MKKIANYLFFIMCAQQLGCAFAIQAPTTAERKAVQSQWGKAGESWPEKDSNGVAQSYEKDGMFMHPDFRDAESFCKNIQVAGNTEWRRVGLGGWIVSAIGAGSTGALAGLAAKSDDKGQTAAFGAGAAFGAVVTSLGVYMITQAANGRRASVAAASVPLDGNPTEDEKWKKCMTVLKTWGDTSADAADKAATALGQAAKEAEKKDDDTQGTKKEGDKKTDEKGSTKKNNQPADGQPQQPPGQQGPK